MCGGDIIAIEGASFGTCDSCGTTSTLPRANEERIVNLFNRANHFRRQNEFDKAMATYENILEEDPNNAEAHWGVVLCRYGIEYVEDPKTGKRIPTCHRVQHASFLTDIDYLAATHNTTEEYTRSLYEEEAKTIAEIQKGILAIASNEDPYDVFICYKETAEGGGRTIDSTLAQDLHFELEKSGLKVFFARITLEDKLGRDYEPYIFNALNTAKVMLVIGTKKEHFEATWVKNEWSRFLALMKVDRSRLLIPCYRDMDGYEIPDELSHLQAQDMAKIGFAQDLLRGIKKVLKKDEQKPAANVVTPTAGAVVSVDSLLKRAFLSLEDGDFSKAGNLVDQVMNIDPENARAYICQLLVSMGLSKEEMLAERTDNWEQNQSFIRARNFATGDYKATLDGYVQNVQKLRELNRATELGKNRTGLTEAVRILENLSGFKNADEWLEHCKQQQQVVYNEGTAFANKKRYSDAISRFVILGEYHDVQEQIAQLNNILKNKKRKKQQRLIRVSVVLFAVASVSLLVNSFIVQPIIANNEYNQARNDFISNGSSLPSNLRDEVRERIDWSDWNYERALVLLAQEQYEEAFGMFRGLDNFKDAQQMALKAEQMGLASRYEEANALMVEGNFRQAAILFRGLNDFEDSQHKLSEAMEKAVPTEMERLRRFRERSRYITLGNGFVAGLRENGTVVAVVAAASNPRPYANISEWTDIVAIAAGSQHIVGLKADGTVVATGGDIRISLEGQRNPVVLQEHLNVQDWTNIVAIAAGRQHTVGLKADGTVVAVGSDVRARQAEIIRYDLSEWTDIVAIATFGRNEVIGLRTDGTIMSSISNHAPSRWTNIVSIAGGDETVVGLRADGTVVHNAQGHEFSTSDWSGIVAVASGFQHIVGLRGNGTVVAVGLNNPGGARDVSSWRDIVAIDAHGNRTIGLTSDGRVVTTGDINVNHLTDIGLPQ